jgi:hypothetical protein
MPHAYAGDVGDGIECAGREDARGDAEVARAGPAALREGGKGEERDEEAAKEEGHRE